MNLLTVSTDLISIFLFTTLFLFFARKVAKKVGLVDKPNFRKRHQGLIPLVGGISVYAGICFTFGIVDYYIPHASLYLACAGVLVFIGALDDRFDISVKIRATIQAAVGIVMMAPEFVLRKPLSIILLITMFFSGGTVPAYLLIQNLGLYDSWWSLILPNAVSAYNIFIYRSFYQGISPEIREAARIDGASEFQILTKIYVPLSKALYATFGLFSVVGVWNSYYEALLYIKDPAKQPIQMLLRKIVFTSNTSNMSNAQQMISNGNLNSLNVQYACVIATIGPILLVYPFIQKYFAQGVQVGAVKG